jgi:hypothetical protein
MMKTKYVKTKDDEIIVFGEIMQHSDFRSMNPVSAGFISFGIDKEGNPTCSCYGHSVSLGLVSDEEKDTLLARRTFGFLWW